MRERFERGSSGHTVGDVRIKRMYLRTFSADDFDDGFGVVLQEVCDDFLSFDDQLPMLLPVFF